MYMSDMQETPTRKVRGRYLCDRLQLLLLYSPAIDGMLEREQDGHILLRTGPFARQLKLNSSKLFDSLLFLQSTGYLRIDPMPPKYGWLRIYPTRPLVMWE